MTDPHLLRSIDQFLGTGTNDRGQLVAKFTLPTQMTAHCADRSKTVYSLTGEELTQKITETQSGSLLQPKKKEAQLEQYQIAMRFMQK